VAASTKVRLRTLWLQVHKWIGITLAILIIPLSLTGSALVWDEWVDGALNPQRYPASGPAALAPSAYADAARAAGQPGERLQSLAFPAEAGSVRATLTKPTEPGQRPPRVIVYLDPGSGQAIERAQGMSGVLGIFHQLHGTLMIPGAGRQIVGWIGISMLLSCLTGLWLWWPVTGSVRRGLRWKRQPTTNANLHHLAGFWIAIPLAILSFTGAWISFPVFLGSLTGTPAPSGPPGGAQAPPVAAARLSPDQAVAAARPLGGGTLTGLTFPTERTPEWSATFAGDHGPAEIKVSDADASARPGPPPPPESFARLMRRLHDGTGMGLVWQIIIFIGGIIPALLAVTGVIMWWRTRKWRGGAAPRRGEAQPQPQGA
jgi:uncharacterized iron-regulated membrane protein